MSDLIDFLCARLDEDEKVAHAVRFPAWYADEGSCCVLAEDRRVIFEGEGGDRRAAAVAHAAHHDPARVLRDVEAKQWLLRRHHKRRSTDWDYPGYIGFECGQCTNEYPCPTLVVLVLPYADHPDFRQEWRKELWR